MSLLLALISPAFATIDPDCAEVEPFKPADYDEQTQLDYLQNYFALTVTQSPVHAPIPLKPGHLSVGVDLLLLPPLKCARRFVLAHTKTEETNLTPMAPRPRIVFAADGPGRTVPYGSFGWVPPVTIFGTRNVIVSGEFGVGIPLASADPTEDGPQVGFRVHATMQKTLADVASAFEEDGDVVLDMYTSSTFGADASFGYKVGKVTPWAAVGLLDASTFFFVGDDGVVTNNLHPYFGPVASVGADAHIGHAALGGEFYAAPGGHSAPSSANQSGEDPTIDSLAGFGRYGHLYTVRARLAWEL